MPRISSVPEYTCLIASIRTSPEVIHSIAFNPAVPSRPILCATSWQCALNLDATDTEDAEPAEPAAESTKRAKKRKRRADRAKHAEDGASAVQGGEGGGQKSHVIRRYGGVLAFSFLQTDVALVVEQPWLRVMDFFPPALYKHRFGT